MNHFNPKIPTGAQISTQRPTLYTRTWHPCQFLKFYKSYTAFTDTLERPECNSDKATVGSVVCTVYTDGLPYKPCVLCQTGLKDSKNAKIEIHKIFSFLMYRDLATMNINLSAKHF